MPPQSPGGKVLGRSRDSDVINCPGLQLILVRWRMGNISRSADFKILVLVVGLYFLVSPLLPAGAIDRWELVHPRALLKIVTALIVIQVLSHIAVRFFGQRRGIMLTGFFAGFVSSTSVFLTLPGKVRESPEDSRYLRVAGLLAIVAMLVELLVILGIISQSLLVTLFAPILAMILTALVLVYRFSRHRPVDGPEADAGEALRTASSVDLRSVAKLSGLIFIVFVAVSASNKFFGGTAATVAVFLAGLFELHAVSYSTAELFAQNELTRDGAILNISVAVVAACISKVSILGFLNRGRFALVMAGAVGLMLGAGGAVLLLAVIAR